MATSKLTVPIILKWEDIEAYMAQHDIVKVVRCKDCRFYETNQDECVFYNAQWVKHDDDFCPYGERRTDDDRA